MVELSAGGGGGGGGGQTLFISVGVDGEAAVAAAPVEAVGGEAVGERDMLAVSLRSQSLC